MAATFSEKKVAVTFCVGVFPMSSRCVLSLESIGLSVACCCGSS